MDNDDIFFYDPSPLQSTPKPSRYTKPADDFRPLAATPSSVFYLAIITPHTDTYTIHGPVLAFSQLLPRIEELASDSPSALDKLEALQYSAPDVWGESVKNEAFAREGFTTFVIEGQRGTYTVLEVLREQNKKVRDVLPAPVYTVTRHGPLVHTFSGVGAKARLDVAKGVAATSALVGSYVERKDAMTAAKITMDMLLAGEDEEKVSRIEDWEKKGGGGVLLAMGNQKRWEVRVQYDDEALRRAREGAEAEGTGVGWRF